MHFALERFLYRLSRSPHAGRFTLKGGLLLRAVEGPQGRPTRDADFLGSGDSSVEAVERLIREICQVDVEPDGMKFDPSRIQSRQTRPDEDYQGVEVKLVGLLERARAPIKVDVAFGDVVTPGAVELDYPVILDFPAPRLRAYTTESVIAEKLHAMVALGEVNGRFKDFYDIWFLARGFEFHAAELALAIRATFERRATDLPREPLPLSEEFAGEPTRQTEWVAFLRRTGIGDAPKTFVEVVAEIRRFLLPVLAPSGEGLVWEASGWSRR